MIKKLKCPNCFAEEDGMTHVGTATYYKCGSSVFSQSTRCRIAELERKLAEVSEVLTRLRGWRYIGRHWASVIDKVLPVAVHMVNRTAKRK